MTLELKNKELGLWIDPKWDEESAATHALVIGVSRYEHFDGGEAPAQDNGEQWVRDCRGLGQLMVSALTAWGIFEWLSREYAFPDAPLASCHLLLAPQPEELAAAPPMKDASGPANFDACKKAIQSWAAHMKRQSTASAKQSRALLFFSGHGMEVDLGHQLLLPSDYLSGETPIANDAIGTSNTSDGMARLPVSEAMLLLDACRNNVPSLRELDLQGAKILTTGRTSPFGVTQACAVLYATAAGRPAYQHKVGGLSIYGEALLDGLRGQSGIEVKQSKTEREISLFNLRTFVESQVAKLLTSLREEEAAALQYVDLSGRSLKDLTVTKLAPGIVLMSERHKLAPRLPWEIEPANANDHRFSAPHAAKTDFAALAPLPSNFWELHRGIDSERVTALWISQTRVQSLPVDATGVGSFNIHRVQRSPEKRIQQIELTVEAAGAPAALIEQACAGGFAYGCVLGLPNHGVVGQSPRYAIDAVYRLPEETRDVSIVEMRARLALDNPGWLHVAAKTWAHVENGNLDLAQFWAFYNLFETPERLLEEAPLASLVGGAVLLRVGVMTGQRAWLENAVQRHPRIADFNVMLALALLQDQQASEDERAKMASAQLASMRPDSILVGSDAFRVACELFIEFLIDGDCLSDDVRPALDAHWRRLAMRRRYFRFGGLFAVFGGYPVGRLFD